jgi:1-acyl-sn-glycerol-3-phosphate acyltransferase
MKSLALCKIAAVFVCFILFFLVLLVISGACVLLKPVVKKRLVVHLIQPFVRCLVKIINIRIKVSGCFFARAKKGAFIISNHSSYVDGFVLGALFPVIYVGKAEIKSWPLIGVMTDFSGTLFIDRKRKNHIAAYIREIADTLAGGVNVLFFPEGTSTNGETLLPFKAAFFEAPLDAGAVVIPVSLVYKSLDNRPMDKSNRDMVYWYGDMTFFGHFFKLLSHRILEVEARIHSPIAVEGSDDRSVARKRASEQAYQVLNQDLHS